MPSAIRLPMLEIQFRDNFLLKSYYMAVHEWLQEYDYVDMLGNRNHNFMEILFLERRLDVRDMRIWWRTYKNIEGNNYYRYRLNILFRLIGCVDREIMVKGQKLTVQFGEISTLIWPYVELDYKGLWAKHKLLKHFDSIFRKRIFYKELDNHKKELYRDVYKLHGMMKKFLEIKSFMPDLESFHEKFDKM